MTIAVPLAPVVVRDVDTVRRRNDDVSSKYQSFAGSVIFDPLLSCTATVTPVVGEAGKGALAAPESQIETNTPVACSEPPVGWITLDQSWSVVCLKTNARIPSIVCPGTYGPATPVGT